MKKSKHKKADCKAVATPQNRALLRTEIRPIPRPDPTQRRPGSLSRSILVLAVCALCHLPSAFAAILVTGRVEQVTSEALDTRFTFTPSEDILLVANGMSAGPAKTVQSTNGNLALTLNAGNYLVRLPLVGGRNAFTISVPHGTGTNNITNMIAAPWTYQDFVNTINTNFSTATALSPALTNWVTSVGGSSTNSNTTSAADVIAIMSTNNAASANLATTATNWQSFTNYTATYSDKNTNRITLSGFNVGNGNYNWSGATWTNSTGGVYFEDLIYYLTNSAGDFLYGTLPNTPRLTVWEDFGGGDPVGTAYFPTNNNSITALRSSVTYPPDFNYGVRGRSAMFGTGLTNIFGVQQNLSGTPFWTEDFPNGAIGSADIIYNGTKLASAAAHRGVMQGDSIFVAASALFDIACTNADFFALGSEFFKVRNGNGVSGVINVVSLDDDSNGANYTFMNGAVITNRNANFSTFLGTGGSAVGPAMLYNTEGSWLGHYGNSTNSGINNSVSLGQGMIHTNLTRSTVIGREHRTVNATNAYIFGHGLSSTSNHVMKLGFNGSHLLIETNNVKWISNGVAVALGGGGSSDYETNTFTGTESLVRAKLPEFNQGFYITNNNTGSSAFISVTAPDDIDQPTTDSLIFNPSGAASAGAYPGWVFGTYPVYAPLGFRGPHHGNGAGLTNLTITNLLTDINAAGKSITNLNSLTVTGAVSIGTLTTTNLVGNASGLTNFAPDSVIARHWSQGSGGEAFATNGRVFGNIGGAPALRVTGDFEVAGGGNATVAGTISTAGGYIGSANALTNANVSTLFTNGTTGVAGSAVVLSNAPTLRGPVDITHNSFPPFRSTRQTTSNGRVGGTTTVVTNTSAAGSTGLGVMNYFQAENSSSAITFVGSFGAVWNDASQTGALIFNPAHSGTDPANRNDFVLLSTSASTADGYFSGSVIATNGVILPSLTNSPPVASVGGAHLWSDGTNLCVIIRNSSTGTMTTNKVTMSTWP